jgi:hypothetical protein
MNQDNKTKELKVIKDPKERGKSEETEETEEIEQLNIDTISINNGDDDHGDKRKKKTNKANKENKKHVVPFWSESPEVLFDKDSFMEIFPSEKMSYNQKLNAITRMILILTVIVFIIAKSIQTILISALTLFAIFILHHYHSKDETEKERKKRAALENFVVSKPVEDYFKYNNLDIPDNLFHKPTWENPYSNVLNSDIYYNPEKKPAPPAFNTSVNDDILKQAKQLVVNANPDQPDIADKLFKDLGDQYVFEQSLRPFNSVASTTVPNDQSAFAEFCYGSMVSCKEGNQFACVRNLSRHTNY